MSAVIKPGFGQEREKLSKVVPLSTPFTLNIVTSTRCNLSCNYCVHSLEPNKKEELGFHPSLMEWDIFEKIADQISDFNKNIKSIFLYGVGEPLCNPLLPRMVRYLKEKYPETVVSFITNGLLLNHESIISLIDSGLDIIRISIQGLTGQKYQEVCNRTIDYNKFYKNLQFLYSNRKQCQVFIKIIDTALEEGEEKIFYDTFSNIADRVYIEKCMPIFEGVTYSEKIKERVITDRYGNLHNPRIVCPMTFFTLSVMPDGEVRPCDNLKSAVELGNINDRTLKHIWEGNELRRFWKMQLLNERGTNPVCKLCVAPDDVSQKEDELDDYREEILERL